MTLFNFHGANRTRLRCAFLLLIWTVFLSACGGSGGGSDDNPNACGVQNCSPYAVISPPTITAYAGQNIDLDGSRSTPSTTLTYQWQQTEGDPVVLSNSTEPVAHFLVPTVTSEKKLIFRLIVSNGNSDSFAEIGITIKPLTVSAQASTPTAAVGIPVLLKAVVGDDSESLQYLWEQIDSGETPLGIDNATSADASFTTRIIPNASEATFRVTVTNRYGATAEDTVSVNLEAGIIPSITAITPSHLVAGEELKISGSGFSNAFAVTLTNSTSHAEATFEVKSDHEIRMIAPETSSGDYALTIQNSGGNAQGNLTIGEPLTDVVQVAAGNEHICAILNNSTVVCWGNNGFGSLGNGNAVNSDRLVTVIKTNGKVLSGVTSISSGRSHTCALTNSQEVFCWGYNGFGQLGDGSVEDKSTAVAVQQLPEGVKKISTGGLHSCAVLLSGKLYCWGANSSGQLGTQNTGSGLVPAEVNLSAAVAEMGLGQDHSCALLENGSTYCWGENADGQLGNGTVTDRSSPTLVSNASGSGQLANVLSLSLGHSHTCALLSSSELQCWGANQSGQLGNGNKTSSTRPVSVKDTSGNANLFNVAKVVASKGYEFAGTRGHTCALQRSGKVACWGDNNSGQLGDSSTTSSEIPVSVHISGAMGIALGRMASCALLADSSVKCWGSNADGMLGKKKGGENSPVSVTSISEAKKITVSALGVFGPGFSCALSGQESTVSCWGRNDKGQLGNNSITDSATATPVGGLREVSDLASGSDHSCAISQGRVYCWGSNEFNQLGGSSFSRSVNLPTAALKISTGAFHSCASLVDGRVYCWGDNRYGDLGNGSTETSAFGVAVMKSESQPLSNIVSISSGLFFSCALTNKGEVYCWGYNRDGQLGNGTSVSSNFASRVQFPDSTLVATSISAGTNHACAAVSGGDLFCWGSNEQNQLGSKEAGSSYPAKVSGIQGSALDVQASGFFNAFGVIYSHSCALLTSQNGSISCWGSNETGQLGAGSEPGKSSATPVTLKGIENIKQLASGGTHSCALYNDGYVTCWGGSYGGSIGQNPREPQAVLR